MSHLPCLGKLSLTSLHSRGADTEVNLSLSKRPTGRVTADEDRVVRPQGPPGSRVRVTPSKQDGKQMIKDIVAKLQMTEAGYVSPLETAWNAQYSINMAEKAKQYQQRARITIEKIKKEHDTLNRLVGWARRPLEHVDPAPYEDDEEGGEGALPDPQIEIPVEYRKADGKAINPDVKKESTALAQPTTQKWELVDHGDWNALVEELEADEQIAKDAEERGYHWIDTAQWRKRHGDFLDALEGLVRDYPDDEIMLVHIAEVCNAFFNSALIANNMFTNTIIMGDPGTGKSRLAGQMGVIFALLGLYVYEVTSTTPLVIASSADFIAEYVGNTQLKVRRFLNKNRERVVFLDEAYSLMIWDRQQEPKTLSGFSPEAVDELTGWLSEHVGQMCLICAGYELKMITDFLEGNDGLARRFPTRFTLRQYSPDQMVRIFYDSLSQALSLDQYSTRAPMTRTPPTVSTYFTETAIELLKDIIRVARLTEVVDARKLLDGLADDDEAAEAAGSGGSGGGAAMAVDITDAPVSSNPEVAALQNEIKRLREQWDAFEKNEGKRVAKQQRVARQQAQAYETNVPRFGQVSRLFAAEAGSMVNLGNMMAVSLASSPDFALLGRNDDAMIAAYDAAIERDAQQTAVPAPPARMAVGYLAMYEMVIGAMKAQFSEKILAKEIAKPGGSATPRDGPAAAPLPPPSSGSGSAQDALAGMMDMMDADGGGGGGGARESASGPSSASTVAPPPERTAVATTSRTRKFKPAYEVGEDELNEALSLGAKRWMDKLYDDEGIYYVWKETPSAQSDAAPGRPIDQPPRAVPVSSAAERVRPYNVRALRAPPPWVPQRRQPRQRYERAPGQFDRASLYPGEQHANAPRRSARGAAAALDTGGRTRTQSDAARRARNERGEGSGSAL